MDSPENAPDLEKGQTALPRPTTSNEVNIGFSERVLRPLAVNLALFFGPEHNTNNPKIKKLLLRLAQWIAASVLGVIAAFSFYVIAIILVPTITIMVIVPIFCLPILIAIKMNSPNEADFSRAFLISVLLFLIAIPIIFIVILAHNINMFPIQH